MRLNPGQGTSSGLTLAECVTALGIMTVVTLSLLSLFLSARTMGAKGEGAVIATNLAETELDRWKTNDFESLETLLVNPETYQVEYLGQFYDVTASTERLSADAALPEYNVLKLSVQLEWQEKKQLTMAKIGQGSVNKTATRMELETMVSAIGSI